MIHQNPHKSICASTTLLTLPAFPLPSVIRLVSLSAAPLRFHLQQHQCVRLRRARDFNKKIEI